MNAVGSTSSPGCRALILAVAWVSASLSQTLQAQTVDILAADQIVRDPAVTDAQRLLGHVQLGHQDGVLHCDSAWRFDDGVVEVFGHVRMEHPPSTVLLADYIALKPDVDWVEARGTVQLDHEGSTLTAPSLRYQMASKKARYGEGARIHDDGWTVTSQTGVYFAEAELFLLGGSVLAVSDQDTLRSDSLHWVRPDDHYTFWGPTTWRSPDFQFTCQEGDLLLDTGGSAKRPTGWLSGAVRVADGSGTVEGDSLRFGEEMHEAHGQVRLASADRQTVAHGHRAEQHLSDSLDLVFGDAANPAWLRQIDGEDTLHISGLELRRAPNLLTVVDSVCMDSEDLQGEGDSLVWDDRLGQIDVFGSPRLWSHMDLLSGDSLTMFLDENRPELLWMRGHAVVLSPANDTLSHRISGRNLDAHFAEGQLDLVEVLGNGQLSYFMVPEPGQDGEVRVNQAVCSRVSLNVDDNALVGVALSQSPEGGIRTVGEGFDLTPFQVPQRPANPPWETSEQGDLAD